jgi:hypothetical protein
MSSTPDLWVSSNDRTSEEEVTRLGRAKAAARKAKAKEGSISQSESSVVVGDMMSTLKRLSISFDKAQLCKQ